MIRESRRLSVRTENEDHDTLGRQVTAIQKARPILRIRESLNFQAVVLPAALTTNAGVPGSRTPSRQVSLRVTAPFMWKSRITVLPYSELP